eukprot:5199466-Prorocentrum_lima.AAC.1
MGGQHPDWRLHQDQILAMQQQQLVQQQLFQQQQRQQQYQQQCQQQFQQQVLQQHVGPAGGQTGPSGFVPVHLFQDALAAP